MTQLATLAGFRVPTIRASLSTIVELRQDEEAFANWRLALKNAMLVTGAAPDEYDDLTTARARLADELGNALAGVERLAHRSPAIEAIAHGSKGLTFAGVGLATGAGVSVAMGNPLLGSAAGLASALGAKGAEVVASYIKNRKEQQRSRVLWDVVMAFSEDP